MKFPVISILAASLLLLSAPGIRAQDSSVTSPTPLADLLTEAEKNNPQIQAIHHGWQSPKQVPTQVDTRANPHAILQQMNVGNPRSFTGCTNSDVADLAAC